MVRNSLCHVLIRLVVSALPGLLRGRRPELSPAWSPSWVATSSSVLAGEVSLTEETGGLQTMGSQKSDTTEQLNNYVHKYGLWGHCFVCRYLCLLYKKEDQTIGFVR